MFRQDLTVEDIQRRIENEWHKCFELYTNGFDYVEFPEQVLRERMRERAFTYGRSIGEMLTQDEWDEVFSPRFRDMWTEVYEAFRIPRAEICESEMLTRGISEEVIEILENGIE